MGFVYEDITLKNAYDVGSVERGIISESEISQVSMSVMVDTGAGTLIISEAIRQELGLGVKGEKKVRLADRSFATCKIADPVEIHWKDRCMITDAMVLDEMNEVLLGAIPLEGLDVIIDPLNQKLIGAHGDEAVCRV